VTPWLQSSRQNRAMLKDKSPLLEGTRAELQKGE